MIDDYEQFDFNFPLLSEGDDYVASENSNEGLESDHEQKQNTKGRQMQSAPHFKWIMHTNLLVWRNTP